MHQGIILSSELINFKQVIINIFIMNTHHSQLFSILFGKSQPYQYQVFSPYGLAPIPALSDQQIGLVAGFTIDKGIIFHLSQTSDGSIQLFSKDYEGMVCCNVKHSSLEKENDWGDWIRGAVLLLRKEYPLSKGLKGVIISQLPIDLGFSQATLLCGFIRILSHVNNIKLSDFQIIRQASIVEREYIGSKNAFLNQVCVLSSKQKLLYFNTKTEELQLISFEKESTSIPFEIAIFYFGASNGLTEKVDFNIRVDERRAVAWMLLSYQNRKLKQFNDTYLGDIDESVFFKHKDKIPMDFQKEAINFYAQQQRLQKGIEAWKEGNVIEFGRVMIEAQDSLIKNYECGTPQVTTLFNILKSTKGVYGARLIGAGSCVCFIDPQHKESIKDEATSKYLSSFPQHKDKFELFICKTGDKLRLTKPSKPKSKNITAIIIAAGYGTRLYPLTQNFPKPLLKVGKRTIIDRLIDDIETIPDITEIIVIVNQKYNQHFTKWRQELKTTKKVRIIDDGSTSNQTRLGAVNDIILTMKDENIDNDILVMAADNIIDFHLKLFVDSFISHHSSMVMMYKEEDPKVLARTGVVVVDSENKIIDMEQKPEKPKSNLAIPAFYGYKQHDLELIRTSVQQGCKTDSPGSLVQYLYPKTNIYGWMMPGSRFDVGDLKTYQQAQQLFPN